MKDWLPWIVLRWCCCLIAFQIGVAVAFPLEDTTPAEYGYFWQLTDIHHDENYTQDGLAKYLCHQQPEEWQLESWEHTRHTVVKVDNATGQEVHGIYGDPVCDAPWTLVTSAVEAMKTLAGEVEVDFILWTGDNLPHIPDSEFNSEKTFDIHQKVSRLLLDTFPNTPFYPTVGNHDSWPSNTVPSVEMDEYYTEMAELAWQNMLDPEPTDTFRKGGYYITKSKHGLWMIGLNTMLWFRKNAAVANMSDPIDQFEWLEAQLEQLRSNNDTALLSGHVPPGYDPLWTKQYGLHPAHNDRLLSIIRQYSDVIVALIVGHYHVDVFRIIYDDQDRPAVPVFVAPSVTPWVYDSTIGTNPALRLYKYSRQTGDILDFTQYYLNLTAANADQRADWLEEYTATEAYGIDNVTGNSLHSLVDAMTEPSSEQFQKYILHYSVSIAPKECTEMCHYRAICGMTNLDLDEYDKCMESFTEESDEFKIVNYIVIPLVVIVVVIVLGTVLILVYNRRKGNQSDSKNNNPSTKLLERNSGNTYSK